MAPDRYDANNKVRMIGTALFYKIILQIKNHMNTQLYTSAFM